MTGRWKINIKGKPEDGGSYGILTCSECNRAFPALLFPCEEDGTFKNPNYCPNCGSDNRDREGRPWTRAEVIRHHMDELIKQYEEYKDEPDTWWWQGEYGDDLTDMIDCHVVFDGDPPCLVESRGIEWTPKTIEDRMRKNEACAECKAKWLMGVYE